MLFEWSFILHLACTLPAAADCTLDSALQYTIHAAKAKAFQGSRRYQPFQTTGINILTLCCFSATGRAQSTYIVMTQHGSFWLPSCPGGVYQNTALIWLLGVNNVIQSAVRHVTSQLQKLFHLQHGTKNTGWLLTNGHSTASFLSQKCQNTSVPCSEHVSKASFPRPCLWKKYGESILELNM